MKEQQEQYNLPENWVLTTIEEVSLRIHYGYTASAIQNNTGTKLLRITDIQNNRVDWESVPFCNIQSDDIEKFKLKENDIVFARTGATVGKSFLIPGNIPKSVFASYLIRIILSRQVNPGYINYFFHTANYWQQIGVKAIGTGQPNVNATSLSNIIFPLCSINEQKLIVSQIETLFSKLDEAKKGLRAANNSLKIYRQALLKNAFEGLLTKKWRKDLPIDAYQELADIRRKRKDKYDTEIENKKGKKIKIDFEFDYKRDNKISSWAVSSLDNLININARIGWRGLTKKEYTSEGALFLSVHSLNYGKNVVFKDANFISIQRYEESPEIQLKENDILLCKDGAGIGKVGIIKKLPDIATVNSSLLVIDAREVFNPDFLYYFFLGPDMQRLVNEKISGSAIPHLFQKDIKKFKLKVPPILEQNKIVEILESRFTLVDNLEKTVDNVLSEIIVLKHSILKKAFEGRLVNYTSDESIENLLNDIQEEKRLYLENQKELNRSKPKQKKKMEEKKTILEILKESNSPISAQELWEKSTSDGDIERFYSEIKEIYHQIDELKTETDSLLSLKDENK